MVKIACVLLKSLGTALKGLSQFPAQCELLDQQYLQECTSTASGAIIDYNTFISFFRCSKAC